jgi:hypothetical protein
MSIAAFDASGPAVGERAELDVVTHEGDFWQNKELTGHMVVCRDSPRPTTRWPVLASVADGEQQRCRDECHVPRSTPRTR